MWAFEQQSKQVTSRHYGWCNRLHLVKEVVQRERLLAETLALARGRHNLADLAGLVQRITLHHLPVVEHALGESLAAGVGAEIGSEACAMDENRGMTCQESSANRRTRSRAGKP